MSKAKAKAKAKAKDIKFCQVAKANTYSRSRPRTQNYFKANFKDKP